MKFKKLGENFAVRLEKGDEIVSSLKEFCARAKVSAGAVSGIGAVGEAEIGFFKTREKEIVSKKLVGDHEIVSLLGNISEMDGEPYLHLHIVLSNGRLECFGGHLKSAVVSVTSEIIVFPLDGKIGRKFSGKIGLNLMEF
ncbi:DNA-binding protein [Candidatus Micrarchaeota archaeon]|nr:DNA-binding protein [Candidatus Micrarchaeota archaeon]